MILEIKEISITDPAEALCELVRVLRAQGLIANTSPSVPEPEPEPEPEPPQWKQATHGQEVEVKENECVVYMGAKDNGVCSTFFGASMYVPSGDYYLVLTRPVVES